MNNDKLVEKYLRRLCDASKIGLRCCIVDNNRELRILKSNLPSDTYYFTKGDKGEDYLNWE